MSDVESIERKRNELAKKRADYEKRLADAQEKQAQKGREAVEARTKATSASSPTTARGYIQRAEAASRAALAEAKKAAEVARQLAGCARQDAGLGRALSDAIRKERADEQSARKRQAAADARSRKDQEEAARRALIRERERALSHTRALIDDVEGRMTRKLEAIRPPKAEPLRILYLTAASEGDLRVDKEIRRVKKGIKSATHRDQVVIEHLSAATASDLLDGLTSMRPHVLHFSGHANEEVLAFDTEATGDNPGQLISAGLFARAVGSVDEPPFLVVLNACKSGGHLEKLLEFVPIAIGMRDSVGDADASSFAARFYSAITEGQSVGSAYKAARVQMELDGMDDAELPVLRSRNGVDPAAVPLVIPAR